MCVETMFYFMFYAEFAGLENSKMIDDDEAHFVALISVVYVRGRSASHSLFLF